MVREGRDFVVIDMRTREDITRATLAQVLFAEESRARQNLLSTDFMLKLLRLRGDRLEALVPDYLDKTLSILAERREYGSKLLLQDA
jgi:polyhydroxyalkanoate synthesis repressor PhaR